MRPLTGLSCLVADHLNVRWVKLTLFLPKWLGKRVFWERLRDLSTVLSDCYYVRSLLHLHLFSHRQTHRHNPSGRRYQNELWQTGTIQLKYFLLRLLFYDKKIIAARGRNHFRIIHEVNGVTTWLGSTWKIPCHVSTAGTSPAGPLTGTFMGSNFAPAPGNALSSAPKKNSWVGFEVYLWTFDVAKNVLPLH